MQKLAHAAQASFARRSFLDAKCALLDNRNQMLTKLNNEAKVRRLTRLVVLGKAKVMSYKDIEDARKSVLRKMLQRARENVDGSVRVLR